MFQKVLIANRGEIAVRIIQACRDLGIISVAVYSEADREALHAQIADEAVCIGPARAADSYLNMDNIISAALASGCQAIHPGFGFLSENPDFAERITQAGLAFIGPTAATIRLMGDKSEAKRNAIAAGVPVAAPSANTSGRPSCTTAAHVREDMDGRIEMILDGGEEVGIGLESSFVDLTGDIPMILRPGYVTQKMLEEVANQVDVDKTILDANCHLRPKAPGMRYRHYAPKGDLTIIEGAQDAVKEAICEKSRQATADGHRVGIIATDETMEAYRQNSNAASIKSVGSRLDEAAVGRSLYRILREFDDENLDILFSESFAESGFGQAIMNRLLKAAGHHVEQV